ncbi:SPOR domain-containing protein [Pigmentiphaga aceris]|uniref:SPOR domain-containing protein n=1 Tax=Pigmentiphaga aceris TaxID=1940612 RepID=A0A5C0B798_9BURK|nr:SPOR domain-containing protein [Pigmentiphaga aceris]QEI08607.1 SPOR domain-containing protein [Pigmentiphaga aceris]
MRVVFVVFLLANVLLLAFGRQWLGIAPPAQSGRDPERITQQVRPDAIRLGTPVDVDGLGVKTAAAAATVSAPPAPVPPPRTTVTPVPTPPEPAPAITPVADTQTAALVAPATPAATPAMQIATTAAPVPACMEWGSFADTELAQALVWLSARFPQLTVNTRRGEEAQSWMVRIPPLRNAAAAQARAASLRQQGIEDVFVFQDPGPNQHAVSLGLFRSEEGARRFMESLNSKRVAGAQLVARSNVRTWLTLRPVSAQVRDGLEAGRSSFPTHTLRECQA